MSSTINYSHCPVCGSSALINVMRIKDFSVSQEIFDIVECSGCNLRFTQNAPSSDEIGNYYKSDAYISHSNTRKGLINRLYHLVRRQTLVGKRKLIEKYTGLKQGDLLDIGAGVGAFAREMTRAGWQVTGLEPDPDARKIAKSQFDIELNDNSSLGHLPAGKFNAITLWHVLEHVHALQDYMKRFKELMAPGAIILIAVPNYTSADARHYGEFWAAYDVPRHLYHFSPASMRHLLESHGFEVTQQVPMWFDSYYVSLLSNKYKIGKLGWLSALWQGTRSNLKAGKDGCSSIVYVGRVSSKL